MDISTSPVNSLNAQAVQQQSELKSTKPTAKEPGVATARDLVQIDGVEGVVSANQDRGPHGDQFSSSSDSADQTQTGSTDSVSTGEEDDGSLDLMG